jgi:aryl-alcohol dehydrogenase-like predicted oxidoreductase
VVAPYLDPRGRGIVEGISRAADGLGLSPLEVALAWVRDRPGVTAPIVGARTAAQLRGALGVEHVELPEQIVQALDDVSGFGRDADEVADADSTATTTTRTDQETDT